MNTLLSNQRLRRFGNEYGVHVGFMLLACLLIVWKTSVAGGLGMFVGCTLLFALEFRLTERRERKEAEKAAEARRRFEDDRPNREARKAMADAIARHYGWK